MSLSQPRIVYGIHSFAPYRRSNGLPYGIIKVLGNSSLSLSGELVEVRGGSNRYPWAIEDGGITAELSLAMKEYPDFVFELFLGKAVTPVSPSATNGTISDIANVAGTSVFSATTGVATVTLKSGEGNRLKFGKYIVQAASATTVHVYATTDVDFQRGVAKQFVNDALRITESALTITTTTAVEIPGFGLELTGGSGTIGMTENDTAVFEVLPQHNGAIDVQIGSTTDRFPAFGAIMVAEARSSGELFEIEAFNVRAIGLPIGLTEKEFSEAEVAAQAFYDSDKDAVLRARGVKAVI